MSYEERLKYLNIESLKKRRFMSVLKIVYKIRFKSIELRDKYTNDLTFYNTTRNGIFCKISKTRIKFCDKNFFIYSSKLFNSLPMYIRNETNFNKYVKYLKCFY